MNQTKIDYLITLARQHTWEESAEIDDEHFDPYDFSEGDSTAAYNGGEVCGKIKLAREILTSLGINWK